MSGSRPSGGAVEAVATLRRALERTADDLAHARLDGLLAVEPELAGATLALSGPMTLGACDAASLQQQVHAARAALGRCLRLGRTLGDVTDLAVLAQGTAGAYDRSGRSRSNGPARRVEAIA